MTAITVLIPDVDLLLDLDLDEDERNLLREYTTIRRGHGNRLVWPVGEIGGQDD